MKRFAIAILLAPLSACGAPDVPNQSEQAVGGTNADDIFVPQGNASAAAEASPGLSLAPDGLRVVQGTGSARQLAFAMPRDQVLRAATATLGKPENQTNNPECPAGALDSVDYEGGLTLFFQDGKFIGWDVDDAFPGRFTTMSGVGIGTTRGAMERSIKVDVEDSSLGVEFRSGGMSGLLSASGETGRVTQLWAGTTCLFR